MCLLGSLVDLLNRGLLLLHQLGDLVVQVAQLNEILLDLANGGGTLEGCLAGIVGLARAGARDLIPELADWLHGPTSAIHTTKLCSWPISTFCTPCSNSSGVASGLAIS